MGQGCKRAHWSTQPASGAQPSCFCQVGAHNLQRLHTYRLLRMQTVGGQCLLPKKTAQVVLHYSSLFATLLKEEASNGGLH